MHLRLNLRLKALEKRLPDEPGPPKALLPEWLMEDLRQQGIRFDASGLPEKSESLARLTGISFEEARERLLLDVSLEDLERMLAEAEAVVGRVAAGKKEKAVRP